MNYLFTFAALCIGLLQPFDYTDQVVTPNTGVRYISGVLGNTRNCGLAIYPDRLAAVMRNQSTAFILEPKSFSKRLDKGMQVGPLLHQYVYLTGRIDSGPDGFGGTLSVASVYIPQYNSAFAYTSVSKCVPFSEVPISVSDAIVRTFAAGGKENRLLVYGYINEERDYSLAPSKADAAKGTRDYRYNYKLYESREAYDDRVFSQYIVPAVSGDLPVGCEGRLVLMEGRLVQSSLNNINYVSMRDAHIVEDTCAKISE